MCAVCCLQVESGYNNTFSQQGDNVTLPMILSEWHKLWNNTMYFPVVLNGTVMDIIADDWMSDGISYDIFETLLQRFQNTSNDITVDNILEIHKKILKILQYIAFQNKS